MGVLSVRKIYYFLLVLFILFALGYSINGKNGILKIIELKRELREISIETDKINRENELLRMKIESLKTDKKAVEFVAREDLGMMRQDEVLVIFKDR